MIEAAAVELIGNFGFPIAAFVLMYRLYLDERDDRRQERSQWLDAIEEHTNAVRSLRHDVQDVATDGGENRDEEHHT